MLLLSGNGDVEVKINRNDEETRISLIQHINYEQDLHMLRSNLSIHRETEVEGYYWQLLEMTRT